nr:hypothetical protein [uncultured Marinifilum sp.]
MMKKQFSDWIKGKQMYGISLLLKGSEDWQVDALELRRKNNQVKLLNKCEGIRSTEDIWVHIPPHSCLSLCISGNGVLLKTITKEQWDNGIDSVLPNVKTEDFVIQRMDMADGRILIALMRRDMLSSILDQFSEHNLWVVDLWLGPICFHSLSSLFEKNSQDILLPGMQIQLLNGKLQKFQKSSVNPDRYYRWGGEDLWGNHLLPYASALSSMAVGNHNQLPSEIEVSSGEYFARNFLIKAGIAALLIIFLSVLVNFFVFDSLRQKQSQLSAQVETGRNLLTKLDLLKEDLKQKNDFLLKSGLNTQSKLSFYADRIAVDLPEGVRLNSMELNPILKKVKKDKEVIYRIGYINVQGETNYPLELNLWIQNLNKEEWVDKVTKQEYLLKQKGAPAVFVMEISVK